MSEAEVPEAMIASAFSHTPAETTLFGIEDQVNTLVSLYRNAYG